MENGPERPEQPPKKKPVARRGFIKGAIATAAGIALSIRLHEQPHQPELPVIPETLTEKPEYVGYNLGFYAEATEADQFTLENFKADCDRLKAAGQNIIRFALRDYEVTAPGPDNSVIWREDNLKLYDTAIQYAKDYGLNIMLVVNTPGFAKDFDDSSYTDLSISYFTEVAKRYGGNGTTMQLFNEPNIHNYRNYEPFEPSTDYTKAFSSLAQELVTSIKLEAPDTKVTVNVGGSVDGALVNSWENFYREIAPSLDYLSLDMYPGTSLDAISSIPDWIRQLRDAFDKDIMISEVGLPTFPGTYTEEQQGNYLRLTLSKLQQARVMGILPYQFRDDARIPDNQEGSFGILKASGEPKKSFTTVMTTLEELAPEKTAQEEESA